MKIFVANLPFHVSSTGIRELFELFGAVISSKIVTQSPAGESKGFGFIEMEDDIKGNEAIHQLDGTVIDGRNIVVRVADGNNVSPKIHKRPRINH